MEAFLRQPLAYKAIVERFPESLPSNDTLMHFLVVELRYRESTAREVIKSFREPIECHCSWCVAERADAARPRCVRRTRFLRAVPLV